MSIVAPRIASIVPGALPRPWRRAWHLTGIVFPLAVLVWPASVPVVGVALLGCAVLSATVDLARVRSQRFAAAFSRRFGLLLKPREARGVTGSTYFCASAGLAIVLFAPPIAAAAVAFLVLGDTAAAVVGSIWGRVRLGRKTVEGTAACFVVCVGIGVALLPLPVAVGGAITAALTEWLSPVVHLDDNLTLPLVPGAVMWLLSAL